MKKQPKEEPVLAVTFIHDPDDPAENRCTLQVYHDAASALAGEVEHLHEQGFKGSHYIMNASVSGIQVSEVGHRGTVANTSFFRMSHLKPGFAEKFS